VNKLICEDGHVKGVEAAGNVYTAEQVVMTIPSPYISALLKPVDSKSAEKIGEVKYFGAVCTILETDRRLSEIYWLNIADSGFPFGGIIEHTNFIEPANYQGKHIVYLSRYFTHDEPLATMPEEEIKKLMIAPLPKIYQGFQNSWIKNIRVFRTQTAATVCDLNFSAKVVDCKLPVGGLYIANMTHIYPDERSVNNSIRIAAEACRVMGIGADFVPNGSSLSGQIGFLD
jgi:protoporphyrinogen oxidase